MDQNSHNSFSHFPTSLFLRIYPAVFVTVPLKLNHVNELCSDCVVPHSKSKTSGLKHFITCMGEANCCTYIFQK
ncbi:hypothetical protein SRHO_G00118450 [Serrasalmus rhombeus]